MKLLELLVKELPTRGGWPEGAVECERYTDKACVDFYDATGNWPEDCYIKYGRDFASECLLNVHPGNTETVTRDQYEEALAASKQHVWAGEGLPAVGVECELSWCGNKWLLCKIEFIGAENVVMRLATREVSYRLDEVLFRPIRPIRTEAERKCEEAFSQLLSLIDSPCSDAALADKIYDAIAAGKIHGVKLDI